MKMMPRMTSSSLIRESRTTTLTCDARQSRMNLSVPALNVGEDVMGLTRVE